MINLRAGIILGVSFLLAACGGEESGPGGGPQEPPPAPVQVTVTPTQAQVSASGTQQFSCTVTGSANTQCNWSVQESAGGSVSASGLYTAPATAGTYHVVAAAAADSSRTATATVTVTAAPPPPPGGGTTPWVTGFYAGYYWEQMYPPQEVDMAAMTHFVFARSAPGGGTLGGQPGELVRGAGGTAYQVGHPFAPDPTRSVEDYLVKRAHDAGTKAILMVGGDSSDGDGFLLSTADSIRPTFVRNIVDYLVAHDYDGVEIDWENRLEGWPERNISAEEARRRLRALLTEIRTEANSRSRYRSPNQPVVITMSGYAKNINFLQPGGRVEQWEADAANLVDQYNLMSYGIGTAFSGAGWQSWFSGPIFGATGTTPYDLDTSIKAYVATGVPRNKLGIGIGFYGMYYGPPVRGPRESTGNNAFVFNDQGMEYNTLVELGYLSNGTYHFDDVAKVGYRSYDAQTYPNGFVPSIAPHNQRQGAGFLSYEDERSIAAKGQWVRETGVGGTIIWTINYGYLRSSRTNPLLAAVKQHFLQR